MVSKSIRCLRFVGRRDELAALEEAKKSLARSSGSFVLISGEAGIGKTRLLTEFLESTKNRRLRNLINTECLARAQQPLGPVRALLRALIPTMNLGALPATILRALVQITPEKLPQTIVAANSGFSLEKGPLFAAVFELLSIVCAKRATILTVEDIHWADESTLEFLNYSAHRLDSMRLIIAATYRSDELKANEALLASLSPLLRAPALRHLVLDPLLGIEIRTLVQEAAEGHNRLPQAVAHRIECLSDGNPFFAEELVSDFIARGDASEIEAELPLSIRASIATRLNALTGDERNVLRHAAVLGQRFDPAVLAVVMDCDSDTILPKLRRAYELNFLIDGDRSRMSCRFRHALTRQTIYDEMPAFEARQLHARILEKLETRLDTRDHLEELAYHAWEAGHEKKSLIYNERAGERAFVMRALPEASICFERALQSASDPNDSARIFERIGALERLHGHYQRALSAFESAFKIRLERCEFESAAEVANRIVGQRYNLGDRSALTFARHFLSEYGAFLSESARNLLRVTSARSASAFYDLNAAEGFLNEVVDPHNLAPSVRQNYLIVQLMKCAYFGDAAAWEQTAKNVDEMLDLLPPEAVVGISSALALTGIYIGENSTVERALERAGRVEKEWGLRGPRLYNDAVEAAYLYQRGRLSEARTRVEIVAMHADVQPAVRIAAPVAAYLAVDICNDAIWKSFGEEYVRAARDDLDDPDCLFLLGAHARLLAAKGFITEAQAEIRPALRALKYAAPEATGLLIAGARILPPHEIESILQLLRTATQSGDVVAAANEALVSATMLAKCGKLLEAQEYGKSAAGRYDALGWPMFRASALELAGEREAALALYNECGAIADSRRLGDYPPTEQGAVLNVLSSRENQIVILVAKGFTNTQIAKDLNIGNKTVEKHLSSVFEKLGLRSRSQVAALVAGSARERA